MNRWKKGVLALHELVFVVFGGIVGFYSIRRISDFLIYGGYYDTALIASIMFAFFSIGSLISVVGLIRENDTLRKFSVGYGALRAISLAYLTLEALNYTTYGPIIFGILSALSLAWMRFMSVPYMDSSPEPASIQPPAPQQPPVIESPPRVVPTRSSQPVSTTSKPEPLAPAPKINIDSLPPPPPPKPEPKPKKKCPRCGESNDPEFNFCEHCGASMKLPKPETPIPTPPPPPKELDPISRMMKDHPGRDQMWTLVLGNDKEDMGSKKLFNVFNEEWNISVETNERLMDSILKNNIQVLPGIRRVILPNGQATTGGYMYTFTKFGRNAGMFSGKELAVLFLGRDEGYVRVCCSTDRDITESQLNAYVDQLIKNPRSAEELSIWLFQ